MGVDNGTGPSPSFASIHGQSHRSSLDVSPSKTKWLLDSAGAEARVGQSYNSDEFMVGENKKRACNSLIHIEMACFVQTINLSTPFARIVIILLYAIFVKDIDINNTTKLHIPSMERHMKIDNYNKHVLKCPTRKMVYR